MFDFFEYLYQDNLMELFSDKPIWQLQLDTPSEQTAFASAAMEQWPEQGETGTLEGDMWSYVLDIHFRLAGGMVDPYLIPIHRDNIEDVLAALVFFVSNTEYESARLTAATANGEELAEARKRLAPVAHQLSGLVGRELAVEAFRDELDTLNLSALNED